MEYFQLDFKIERDHYGYRLLVFSHVNGGTYVSTLGTGDTPEAAIENFIAHIPSYQPDNEND